MKYHVIGVMSGTSLDGIDLAYCTFRKVSSKKWEYSIIKGSTYSYTQKWEDKLRNLETSSALDFALTDKNFGQYIGEVITDFINEDDLFVDFVASHGHTIFHQPENRLTTQIGCGATIAATCKRTVVNNFRVLDVALGGQGAPLVPIGDLLLFDEYEYCLNLGGISNISYSDERKKRIAYDIAPANMVCNYLANKLGKPYDQNGDIARSGTMIPELFDKLNSIPYYDEMPPKSLGKEYVFTHFIPLLESYDYPVKDLLRTFTEHMAFQISQAFYTEKGKVLITGGGAYNKFLIEELEKRTSIKVCIPDDNTINFKEALLFAFLGVLRYERTNNCIKTVTGASRDSCGGVIHLYLK